MDLLTIDDFKDRIGQRFDVSDGISRHALTLEAAAPIAHASREGGGFRLEWLGPADPILQQAIYRMSAGERDHDIFIVPIGRNEAGTRYEAVFN